MGVSAYSIIVSVLFFNLSLVVVNLLRHSGAIRAKNAPSVLLLLTLLGLIRLFTPLDWGKAHIIRSYRLLPTLRRTLNTPVLGPLSLGSILAIVWAAGTLVFLLRDLVRQRRFVRSEKDLPLSENEQISRIAAEFGGGFALKISPEIEIPYVTGLFKPVIYVPDIQLGDEDWRNIFRHETQHIRSHDEWKKLLFRGIRALFWWNPLLKLSEKDISLLIELQCDARVAGNGSPDEQEAYLHTMLELLKRQTEVAVPIGASGIVGKQDEMKIRFEALLAREPRHGKLTRTALSVLMLAVFAASYFVIIQPASFPSEEEILANPEGVPAYDITNQWDESKNDFILYDDGEYKLYINGEYAFSVTKDQLSEAPVSEIPIIGG